MSLALCYWMGDAHHCSGTPVSEMTYTVSSGMLNPTIPYHTITRRYCIKTAKPIWKLFQPFESKIILVSSDPCADTQFQGEPLQQGC